MSAEQKRRKLRMREGSALQMGRDRDFIRSREGMFFCVTGYLHPPDRYTAYLKYTPASSGKWGDGETAYRRELPYYHVRTVEQTIRYLEQHYPHYVYDCPVRNIRFSMVPHEYVAHYYDPQERMKEILTAPRDPLEEEVQGLAMALVESAAVGLDDLGITGSTLIGLHNPAFSDIDLLVCGRGNAWRVREALLEGRSARIRGLGTEFIEEWSQGIAGRFPLTMGEARYLASRRWNYGFYGQRYFSIHPTRTDAEITERYGDHVYRDAGVARVRATVVGVGDALFMPATYRVADVYVVEGDPEAAEIREIVSFEGLYRDIVNDGEEVEARGKLERVSNKNADQNPEDENAGEYYRLVIGTTMLEGEGYIKPGRLGENSD